jgi:tRNA A-37 threonylcarbamoyl transferase component Bud32
MHVAAGTGRVVAGRYYLQDPIGRGAMGTVWRARDALLARDVAIKEVLLRGASTPDDTRVRYERTLREARTAARLNHPAVVTIFDVVEADGRPWIVMELVQARSLEQILAKDGPLPPHKAADAGQRLLGALTSAHAAGILHRDVKPSNVLLGADDRAVLTDFGIATLAGDPGLTQVGMVMGTPGFTAPERVRGDAATPASDLWSLGATLYAAVEGHGPFDQLGSSLAVLSSIANEDAPRPRSAGALGPAIEALLRRDPSARPDAATAGRLLAAAVRPPAADQFPGGRYQEDPSPGTAFRRDSFQAGPFQGNASHYGGGYRGDAYHGDAYHGDGYRGVSGPTAPEPPAAELPAWMSFPGGGSPPGGTGAPAGRGGPAPMDLSAGAATRPPPAPAVAKGALPQANRRASPARSPSLSPRGPDLGRAIGLPARASTPAATGLLDAGTALSRPPGHPPGRHGPPATGYRLWRPARQQRRRLVALGAAAIVCAGVVGGLAIGHSPLPAGYRLYTASPAATGTAAGFTTAVPSGWQASTRGLITDVSDPAGRMSMQVDLTPFEAATAPGEASLLDEQALTDNSLPGYHLVALHSFLFRGNLGAAWEFTWQEPRIGRLDVLDVLFKERSQAGRQACKLQVSGPMADRATNRAIVAEALRTFAAR